MSVAPLENLPVPVQLSSPCGKRSRILSGEHEGSPNKIRAIETHGEENKASPLKLFSAEKSPAATILNKENNKNSPHSAKTKRSSVRLRNISQSIKKRASLGFKSPPKLSGQYNYPSGLISPPTRSEKHTQALKEAIANPNVESKRQRCKNMDKKAPFRSPVRLPSFSRTPRGTSSTNQPDLPNLEMSSPTSGPPQLSRSISMYSLSPENPSDAEAKIKSKLASSLNRPAPRTPKKKKNGGSLSFSSLRGSRKRSVTDFKLLFTRGPSQSSVNEETSEITDEEPVSRYFGHDLEELMHFQRVRMGLEELKVPFFIHVCCSQIRSYFLNEEGLFRVSPSLTTLNEAVSLVENSIDFGKAALSLGVIGDDSKTQFKSHVYSGMIKKYLRDLPEPLLGFNNYDRWISCISPNENPQALKSLLQELPTDSYNLLEAIISLAYEISAHQDTNRMSVESISRVIGPNILWNNQTLDPLASSEQFSLINHIAEYFITNYKIMFSSNSASVQSVSQAALLTKENKTKPPTTETDTERNDNTPTDTNPETKSFDDDSAIIGGPQCDQETSEEKHIVGQES